ncbi:hypothetical protein MIDIC_10047 [Alphaproteobacteria bacterium]
MFSRRCASHERKKRKQMSLYRVLQKEIFNAYKAQKVFVYCCFDSRLAKEINVQAIDKGLVKKGWGTPESPNCSGFSVEELQNTDFSQIDFSFMAEEMIKVLYGVRWEIWQKP